VHCSAGAGRTGVFLVCKKGRKEIFSCPNPALLPATQVRDTVVELRQYRNGLVQTPDQYNFIYERFNQYYHQVIMQGIARS